MNKTFTFIISILLLLTVSCKKDGDKTRVKDGMKFDVSSTADLDIQISIERQDEHKVVDYVTRTGLKTFSYAYKDVKIGDYILVTVSNKSGAEINGKLIINGTEYPHGYLNTSTTLIIKGWNVTLHKENF